MKVTIDLENLENLVQKTIENNIESVVKTQIESSVKNIIDNLAKKVIDEKVSNNFQRFVDEYIATTKILVGGGYWDNEEPKEYTVEQYIKKGLKESRVLNYERKKEKDNNTGRLTRK